MRFFVAAMVASIGVGLYAIAALVWDRRRQLVDLSPGPRVPASVAAGLRRPLVLHGVILGAVLLGTLLIFGSCLGLVRI